MKIITSYLLIFFGISVVFLSSFLLWQMHNPQRLSFAIELPAETDEVYEKFALPVVIEIADIGVKLPLIPARLGDGAWPTTSKGVSYLRDFPLPGSPGNSIMYGHNWGSLLGRLGSVNQGTIITIHYSDGTTNSFEVSLVDEVAPSDTSVLAQTDDHRITLYTCSGLFDRKRLVVTAFLIEPSQLTFELSTR